MSWLPKFYFVRAHMTHGRALLLVWFNHTFVVWKREK